MNKLLRFERTPKDAAAPAIWINPAKVISICDMPGITGCMISVLPHELEFERRFHLVSATADEAAAMINEAREEMTCP